MPDAFYRLLAFPNGIAMIALGYSLWKVARTDAAPDPADRRRDPTAQHGRRRMNTSPAPTAHGSQPGTGSHRRRLGGGAAGRAGGFRPPCWRWP